MGVVRDLFWAAGVAQRMAEAPIRAVDQVIRAGQRDARHSARRANQQLAAQARAAEAARVARAQQATDEWFRSYFTRLLQLPPTPRLPHQDAKLPHASVRRFSSDQVDFVFRRSPVRSLVCHRLGLWFGWYAVEGEVWILTEQAGHVYKALVFAEKAQAAGAWGVISWHCGYVATTMVVPPAPAVPTPSPAAAEDGTKACRQCGKPGMISNDTCRRCRQNAGYPAG